VNNPLKYSDPSGDLFGIDDAIIFSVLCEALYSGGTAQMNGGSFVGGFLKGAVIGAASAAIPYGIGEAFGHELGTVGTELLRAGVHGLGNGLLNVMQGGSFGSGFATGAVASLVGSGAKAEGFGPDGVIGACTAAGAGASALSGGNWMTGAMQGMDIGTYNHEGDRYKDLNGSTYTEDATGNLVADNSLSEVEVKGDIRLFYSHLHLMNDLPLQNVYPEFDVLMAARGVLNTIGIVSKTESTVVENVAVHGNSLKSLKPTWGYKLYSTDGTFLKNGITSELVPESRYTKAFMSDKLMLEKTLFQNRSAAYQWEFQQNQILRGPLNFNMH
jgi:hypothetical protein